MQLKRAEHNEQPDRTIVPLFYMSILTIDLRP